MKMMQSYKDKGFKSVADEDMSGDAEKDQEKKKQAEEENKELISFIKEVIGDKISDVVVSTRLSDSPCCMSSKGEISLEMEKTLNRMPGAGGVKAERVLEINPDSSVISKIRETLSDDKEKAAAYARLLYDQAVILSGLELDDPAGLADDINSLISK
jgi:molecular chaperone HtpG